MLRGWSLSQPNDRVKRPEVRVPHHRLRWDPPVRFSVNACIFEWLVFWQKDCRVPVIFCKKKCNIEFFSKMRPQLWWFLAIYLERETSVMLSSFYLHLCHVYMSLHLCRAYMSCITINKVLCICQPCRTCSMGCGRSRGLMQERLTLLEGVFCIHILRTTCSSTSSTKSFGCYNIDLHVN